MNSHSVFNSVGRTNGKRHGVTAQGMWLDNHDTGKVG